MAIKKEITFEGLTYKLDDKDRVAAAAALSAPELEFWYPKGVTENTNATTAMVAGYVHTLVDVDGGANVLPTLGVGDRIKLLLKGGITSNTVTITTTSGQTFHTSSWYLTQDIVDGSDLTVQASTATAGDNTITLNGGTKGGQGGDELTFIGVSSTLVYCELRLNGVGTIATPFSTV